MNLPLEWGTSPVDPASYLKIDAVGFAAGATQIHFTAMPGKTYSVLYRNNATSGPWLKLAGFTTKASGASRIHIAWITRP